MPDYPGGRVVVGADPAAALTADDLAAARRRVPWPPEAVYFTSVRAADRVTAALYADTVSPQGEREAGRATNGVYTQGVILVTVYNPLAAALGEPKARDLVTWRDRDYVVTAVVDAYGFEPAPFWKLTAVSPRIAKDLHDTLTALRPAVVSGDGGLGLPTAYTAVWTGDGRMQPDGVTVKTDDPTAPPTEARFTAILSGTVRVQAGDLIQTPDGTKYPVDSQGDIDQLGVFTAVACTLVS